MASPGGRLSSWVFPILLLQPILASRWGWIERSFGLDTVVRFHRNATVIAVCPLAAHPVLIAAGTGQWKQLYFSLAAGDDLDHSLLMTGGILVTRRHAH